jgi:hypothetical protein
MALKCKCMPEMGVCLEGPRLATSCAKDYDGNNIDIFELIIARHMRYVAHRPKGIQRAPRPREERSKWKFPEHWLVLYDNLLL